MVLLKRSVLIFLEFLVVVLTSMLQYDLFMPLNSEYKTIFKKRLHNKTFPTLVVL